ncbi:MAG: lamin tail domain-containing protein [Planctomycetes bacterium]|nr:lamin tail domain-containing protein [Planctomycetota bacterium]
MSKPWIVWAVVGLLTPGAALYAGGDLATPVINEFLASNGSRAPLAEGDLLDADGDSSDWIELHNPTPETFDLGGWYLTDDPCRPARWRFPAPTRLAPDGYLLIFASGKDRTAGELHTNFKLAAEGGYVALVLSDGRTAVSEYGPSYPPQRIDISYGLTQYRTQLVTTQSLAAYRVPRAEDQGSNWMAPDFDDGLWPTLPATLSFSQAAGGPAGPRVKNPLHDAMFGRNSSVWIRIAFVTAGTEAFETLLLNLQYEDGFVAWLNGVEVARDNLTGTARWDSVAGRDRPDGSMQVPVVFDLSGHKDRLRPGRNVLALQGLNDHAADPLFLIAPQLVVSGAAQVPHYLARPTPGRPNTPGPLDIVADPRFSHEHGLYDVPFSLALSCETPGAFIRYTTNGAAPSETSGAVYTAPIPIRTTTCVRALAFRAGSVPSEVRTHTFLFPNDVERQSALPVGFPTTWGSTTADYEMDPDIVNGVIRPQLVQALKSLPSMSLVMNVDDLFGPAGVYTNWSSSGDAWERPGSVELIYPDGTKGFQVNCGVRIYGNVGRREAKKSFRLKFTRAYGPTELHYPLFGAAATDRFDQLILRANFNDAYSYGAARAQFIRDEFTRRLQLALGDPSAHGTFVHLYINGLYWGLYNPLERPEASFAATYFGGRKEDWDALNSARPLGDSTLTTWNALLNLVRQGLASDASYQRLQGNNPDGTRNPQYVDYLDVDNYINYLLVNFFIGNKDWPGPATLPGHNWYAAMNRVEPTGWKCFSWDAEHVLGLNSTVTENITNVTRNICEPYAQLRANAEFCLRFGDRVQQVFFHGGPLYVDSARPQWDPSHPERNRPAALYADLASQIEPAVLAESARWGDCKTAVPYRIDQWRSQRDWVLNTYMPQRSANVLGQLRIAGLYPLLDAPTFLIDGLPQQGGAVPSDGVLVMMASAGATIYYTTDGSDPRTPGFSSTDNQVVTLVPENAPKRVLVPSVANGGNRIGDLWRGASFDDFAWRLGTGGAGYERSSGYQSLFQIDVGVEMYKITGSCFMRIPFTVSNTAYTSLTLKVRYDDGFIAYLNGTEVARRNFTGEPRWNSVGSADNPDAAAMEQTLIDVSAHAGLLRSGVNLLAVHGLNGTIDSSDFLISVELAAGRLSPGTVSPTALRYAGPLPLRQSAHFKARAFNGKWSALNEAVFAVGPVAQGLRVSELMYHPRETGRPDDPNAEFIELTNVAEESINLALVRFTEGIHCTFPGFTLSPGGYCLVVKDRAAFQVRYGSKLPVAGASTGSLDNGGERITLVDALGAVVQSFTYDDSWFKTTDGQGFSLTVKDPQTSALGSLNDKNAWRPSTATGGSPGARD